MEKWFVLNQKKTKKLAGRIPFLFLQVRAMWLRYRGSGDRKGPFSGFGAVRLQEDICAFHFLRDDFLKWLKHS